MTKLRDIQLPTTLKERLAQGHPWVYRNHVPPEVRLPSGSWVRLRCGNWRGYALWDAAGPIALRVFSERQPPDAVWVRERVRAAWEMRAPLRESGCTAYRLLFGEGDYLPGLTVDLYGEYAVLQTYMDGADELVRWLLPALRELIPLRGIVGRVREDAHPEQADREVQTPPDTAETRASFGLRQAALLWGEPPPRDLVVFERDMLFYADLQSGQKTGLFLDQRENRRFIEGLSGGREVLNCFAYTGAFSLYALRGGANHVTSNDIGKGLAEAAEANIALNALDATRHTFVTGDSFDLLNQYVEQGRSFDLVILDPPSFAKNKQSRFAAIRAYTRLNALAHQCVRPGGILATASCTSQVGPEAFRDMLAAAGASAGRRLQMIHEAGHALDHPVPAGFPEGRYLKFIIGRVVEAF